MPKKILFISHDASRTGAPFVLLYFLRWLKKNTSMRFEIMLINGGELEKEFSLLGPIYIWNKKHSGSRLISEIMEIYDFLRRQRMVLKFRRKKFDLIFANSIATSKVIVQLRQFLDIPVICYIHELEVSIAFWGKEKFASAQKYINYYIGSSGMVVENLKRNHGVPEEKMDLVYDFIPANEFHRKSEQIDRKNIRKKLGIPDDAFIVGSSGTIGLRKGFDLIPQILKLIADKTDVPVYLLWIGGDQNGIEFFQILQDVEKLDLADRLHFVSYSLDYFSVIDAFLLPSREDPFPLVCLQAAALKKPILCFEKAGGMPEFVKDECGFSVPYLSIDTLADKIIYLAQNRSKALELGKNAYKKSIANHDVGIAGNQLVAIIEKISDQKLFKNTGSNWYILYLFLSICDGSYKFYKKNVKKWIPRFIFTMLNPILAHANRAKNKINNAHENRNKYKRDIDLGLKISDVEKMTFKNLSSPEVSIIIPVFNKWRYTHNCLKSIKENISHTSFEIIVVDNASSDETSKLIGKMENVICIRNNKNEGFVGACNIGAKNAKGKYLVFLNNDTSVLRNWLESLLETFKNNNDIGLVGSKLIYPDGKLQEAGGIVWSDIKAGNYGNGRDPYYYEFNYLKDVDYCSGASIMVLEEIFKKLNGFDLIFSPAYYEDTDLAFRIRKLGLRTVYQPKSELVHFEGVTAGKDTNVGFKKYQKINEDKFFSRWEDALKKENTNSISGTFLARDRSKNKKVILFIDRYVPEFDKDAGSFIANEYLKILNSNGFKVILWPHDLNRLEPYSGILQQQGIEVVYGNIFFKDFMKENGRHIDYVFASRPYIAIKYIEQVKKYSNAKIIYIAHDLSFLREQRVALLENDTKKMESAKDTKKLEYAIMKKSDISLFFSGEEVGILKKEEPQIKADLMPWVEKNPESADFPNFKMRKEIIFVGGFLHNPNVDSVIWFHDKIFPLIKEKIPGMTVNIIGSNPPKEITDLNSKYFKVWGFVEEDKLQELFNKARVFIAPLRVGAGFKGKIAKAMRFGVPVVTTKIGAEGMDLADGMNVLIANDENTFAQRIMDVYSSEELWMMISKGSVEYIKNNCSSEYAKNKLFEILNRL